MKNKITLAIVAFAALVITWKIYAGFTIVSGLITVNNTTNNTTPFTVGALNMGSTRFYIQNGGLNNTNDMKVNLQLSADNTNFVTILTYQAGITNPQTDTYAVATNLALYMRAQIITTNSITGIGISVQQ